VTLFFLDCVKRSSSYYFSVRLLSKNEKVYESTKYDRSILLANDDWKHKQLVWHGFATKLSQETIPSALSSSSLNTDLTNNCSVTQLERGKRVSDSSWEIVWNIKKLSINGYVNVMD